MVGVAGTIPVEEDGIPGSDIGVVSVPPLAVRLEPSHAARGAPGKPGLGKAHLGVAPGNKAGAPLHPAGKAVPAPVGIAPHLPHLGQGDGCNFLPPLAGAGASANSSQHGAIQSKLQRSGHVGDGLSTGDGKVPIGSFRVQLEGFQDGVLIQGVDGGGQVRNRLGLWSAGRIFLALRSCILLHLYLGCLHLISDGEQLVGQSLQLGNHILLAGTQLFHGNGIGAQDVSHIVGGVPRLVIQGFQGELLVVAAFGDEVVDPFQGRLVGRLQSVRHYPGQPCHRLGQGEGIGHVRTVEAEHLVSHNGGQGREQHDQDEEKQADAHQNLIQSMP